MNTVKSPGCPNLLILGAMKASTTLLYEMLGRHPQIWFSREKEPHYFTRAFNQPDGWDDYLKLFADCPREVKYVGEASTGYSKVPLLGPTPQRIAEKLGRPKMIYILRDPVARAISNYRHAYARGFYPDGLTFGAAMESDPIVLAASRYATQIRAYEEVFGEGALLVLIAEDLHARPQEVMADVERYLDLPPFDGWCDDAPRVANSAESVRVTAGWNRVLGKTWSRRLSSIAPTWTKRFAKRTFTPPVPQPPPVSPADEQRCFESLVDDLDDLLDLLGDRIAGWPSVRKLGRASGERKKESHDDRRRGTPYALQLNAASH